MAITNGWVSWAFRQSSAQDCLRCSLNRFFIASDRFPGARVLAVGRWRLQDRVTLISAPDGTDLRTLGSPLIIPSTLTGLAGLISSPRLIGVGPKNRQSAFPGGQ